MAVLLAILAGIGSFFIYSFWQVPELLGNLGLFIAQIVMFLFALVAVFSYKGKRFSKMYFLDNTHVFTIRFLICLISLLGSGSILVVMALFILGN
ncbi:hypothetical protein [Pilibacter termitis]|uniref:hypothetical protein n=1 Tax=Pilibacter termitis TaxID=263852 RepID=UPI0009996248|nr:hypothetical protein [Pilibacter termitis]